MLGNDSVSIPPTRKCNTLRLRFSFTEVLSAPQPVQQPIRRFFLWLIYFFRKGTLFSFATKKDYSPYFGVPIKYTSDSFLETLQPVYTVTHSNITITDSYKKTANLKPYNRKR